MMAIRAKEVLSLANENKYANEYKIEGQQMRRCTMQSSSHRSGFDVEQLLIDSEQNVHTLLAKQFVHR